MNGSCKLILIIKSLIIIMGVVLIGVGLLDPVASLSTCHLGLWLGWQIFLNLVNGVLFLSSSA